MFRYSLTVLVPLCVLGVHSAPVAAQPKEPPLLTERTKPIQSPDGIFSFAISRDGQQVVLPGTEGVRPNVTHTVSIWNLKSRDSILIFRNQSEPVAIALDPIGKYLACAFANETVRLGRIGAKGAMVESEVLKSFPNGATRLAFSPDGKLLVGIANDTKQVSTTTIVWDLATGRERQLPKEVGRHARAVAFSPDGKYLAIGTGEVNDKGELLNRGALEIITVESMTLHKRIVAEQSRIEAICYALDGKSVAVACEAVAKNPKPMFSEDVATEGLLQVWDTASWKVKSERTDEDASIASLAYSPDGALIAYGTGTIISPFPGGIGQVRRYGEVRVLDSQKLTQQFRLPRHGSSGVPAISFLPQGKTLVTVDGDSLRFWGYDLKP